MEDEKTLDNSETNNEANEEETSEKETTNDEKTSEKQTQEEETSKDDEQVADYRPKPEKKKEPQNVPLAKYVAKKKELKKVQDKLKELESGGDNETNESSDDLDSKIVSKVKEAISPLLEEKQKTENLKNFEKDFEKSIASKYPKLAGKKKQFQEIAFNPNLVDEYPTLESIREAYFADAKKTKTEGGSKGTSKGSKTVDFKKASDDPELYKEIMDDPKLKKDYFAYLDSQGL